MPMAPTKYPSFIDNDVHDVIDKYLVIDHNNNDILYPLHSHGKLPFLIGKPSINGHFPWLC